MHTLMCLALQMESGNLFARLPQRAVSCAQLCYKSCAGDGDFIPAAGHSQAQQHAPQQLKASGRVRCMACLHQPMVSAAAPLLHRRLPALRPAGDAHVLMLGHPHRHWCALVCMARSPGTCSTAGGSTAPLCTAGGCSDTARKAMRPCTCSIMRVPAPLGGSGRWHSSQPSAMCASGGRRCTAAHLVQR